MGEILFLGIRDPVLFHNKRPNIEFCQKVIPNSVQHRRAWLFRGILMYLLRDVRRHFDGFGIRARELGLAEIVAQDDRFCNFAH